MKKIDSKMADFLKTEEEEQVCVVSVSNGHAYDHSRLENNAHTYYTEINYEQLKDLYEVIRNKKETKSIAFQTIKRHIEEKSAKVFFDIKCSSECHSGSMFVDNATTLSIFKMVNTMTRLGCNIVVGDHSMGSLFNNWDKHRMDFPSPIEVCIETTQGGYKMKGKKSDFESSCYPILKNLGKMSAEENVEIEFENMSGTKIYKIKEGNEIPVRILSNGGKIGEEMNEIVHSEFDYRNGKIIISATHWCNLTEVNTEVNMLELSRQCTVKYGAGESARLMCEYNSAVETADPEEVKRVISEQVRYMCSGQRKE